MGQNSRKFFEKSKINLQILLDFICLNFFFKCDGFVKTSNFYPNVCPLVPGSPALPASEEGFQPMPSVTIRPADDSHLPSANTCISRLYVPLYSSKNILKSKLLMAIKTKNFGFV